jgi:HNH endonuclease
VFISLFGCLPCIVSFSDSSHLSNNFFALKVRKPDDPNRLIFEFIGEIVKEALNFDKASIASKSRSEVQVDFKTRLKTEYNQPDKGNLFDMATGECLPHSVVVAAHIFQHNWRGKLSKYTSLTDINDVRNGLLLYKPVEWAFDRAKMCVEVDTEGYMTFRLLDTDLAHIELADMACNLRDKAKRGSRRLPEEEDLRMTFGDLNGQPLQFPSGVIMRPSKRLLGLHAVVSQWTTTPNILNVAYNLSGDEATEQAVKNFSIYQWMSGVQPTDEHSICECTHQSFGLAILTYHLYM